MIINLMTDKISFKEMIPTGDSMQVLKHFQKEYNFDTDDNLIYFLTTNAEIKNCTSFDQRLKVKFGYSEGGFERRFTSYSHGNLDMPFLIAVMTVPNMHDYNVFYPDTEMLDTPSLINEERRLKRLWKDRTYQGKSKEKVMVTLKEVCDYFETRQKELNEMYEKYCDDSLFWRIPFQGHDGHMHNRIEYWRIRDSQEIKQNTKECEDCKGKGTNYKKGKYPNFTDCKKCDTKGFFELPFDDSYALKNSIIEYKDYDRQTVSN